MWASRCKPCHRNATVRKASNVFGTQACFSQDYPSSLSRCNGENDDYAGVEDSKVLDSLCGEANSRDIEALGFICNALDYPPVEGLARRSTPPIF